MGLAVSIHELNKYEGQTYSRAVSAAISMLSRSRIGYFIIHNNKLSTWFDHYTFLIISFSLYSRQRRKLVPFPERNKRAPRTVNIIFNVLPSGYPFLKRIPDNLYWWPDVKFLPFSDHTLVVSAGAFLERPGMSPLVASGRVHGLLYRLTIREDRLGCFVYKGTSTSVNPNICVHPNGVDVSYAGCGRMCLMDLQNQYTITRDKDVRNNNFKYTECSPNGLYIATVAKCSASVELHVMIIERSMFVRQYQTDLHKICPQFKAIRNHSDYFECRFSADSTYIAVGSSHGHLIVVKRSGLHEFCNVIPGLFDINDVRLANERSFDFDPRYRHRFLAFGSRNNEVFICNVDDGEIYAQTKFEDLDGEINTVKYGPRHRGLAVATSTSVIYVCDPDTLDVLYTLNGAEQGNAAMEKVRDAFPQIVRMSFSTAGDNLAVTSTDGFCRIWQLDPVINLQEICRLAILRHCKVIDLEKLPLPHKLVIYLFNWPE